MDRNQAWTPRVTAALVFTGLWLRAGLVAAFSALSAPLLVFHGELRAGDGVALLLLGAGFAWLAWRRTRALLGDDTPEVASPLPSARNGAAAA
ncbi:MAG TPA: hypothetical protein VII68_00530 [Casimicrobiaceae bacterium]|jgi:hypothetical protein